MTGSAAEQAAVLVPGARYSTDGPLLMYAGLAVERRGGHRHPITWTVPGFTDDDQERAWVSAQVTAAIAATAAATGVRSPVLIGKSMGSLSAPVAADRGLAAVWLTPVLTDGPTARSITPHVLEVEGADHGMFVPGALAASALALGQVITAVENFLDHVVWP